MGKTRGTPVVLVRNKGVLRNLAEKEGSGEMTTRLTKQCLKERTQEYWKEKPGFEVYINELLGRELKKAISQPRGAGKPVHTLALTVGESFEPLLQVICVLRPRRVVLILNQFYSGTPGYDHGRELQDLIEKLPHVPDPPQDVRPGVQDIELIELKNDSPTQVFRALLDTMRKPEAQLPDGHVNVVDITGAKKSIVVGAFLYAAHSGLPITYEAKSKDGSTLQSVATAFGNTERDAFASLMDESSEWKFRRALQNQEGMNVKGGNVRRSSTAPLLQPYYNNLSLDLEGAVYTDASGNTTPLFVKLRGEAIHTHLYIPRNVAEAALELVQAAVKEFETNWLDHFHPGIYAQAEGKRVEAPSWSRLCEICELDFLPPRLRE